MKHLIIIAIALLISCAPRREKEDPICYLESRLGFYDPLNKDFTIETWIRRPENIRTLHETLKKFGYDNIISDDDLNSNPCMIWSYVNKPCADIIDSLIVTYPQIESAPKYYVEFWKRRKAEQNDTTVFTVLKEIKQELMDKTDVPHQDHLTNDTILNLLQIKYKMPENEEGALESFEYLKTIGLNQSAYNVLFEWSWYDAMQWNREKLKERLTRDSTGCEAKPVIEDDTK